MHTFLRLIYIYIYFYLKNILLFLSYVWGQSGGREERQEFLLRGDIFKVSLHFRETKDTKGSTTILEKEDPIKR